MKTKKFKANFGNNFWKSYAKTTTPFQYAIGELIDNAISARPFMGKVEIPALIELSVFEQKDDTFVIHVADNGTGVEQSKIIAEDNIFNIGSTTYSKGKMNEHGFGLKNGLAMLTSGFSYPCSFITKTKDESEIARVDGPLQNEMELKTTDMFDWNDGINELACKKLEHGTKISAIVDKNYFWTLYPPAKQTETLYRRLGEHLGVFYFKYLQMNHKIFFSYKTKDAKDITTREIIPIPPPFLNNSTTSSKTNVIDVEVDGKIYKAKYTSGLLDTKFRDMPETDPNWPFGLKSHYVGSNARCGLTIIVRDRVLKTAVFDEIWPNRDVSYNNFLASVEVGSEFATTNNKLDIDCHDKLWKTLYQKLADDSNFRPEKHTKKQSEENLRKRVVEMYSTTHKLTGKNKPSHHSVWDKGADIDVYFETSNGVHIYELKINESKVLDVYQLKMYWDGIVEEQKRSPYEAILVAEKISKNSSSAIAHINSLKDKLGNNYSLDTQTHDKYPI